MSSSSKKNNHIGYYYQPYHNGKDTIFCHRIIQKPHDRFYDVKILLTKYMKDNFISREQIYTLAKRKLLSITSYKNRLYVSEICPLEDL